MNAILTNLDKPLIIESINHGHIVIDDLKVWPGWKEHSGVVATYQWKSQPNVIHKIEIGNDKVITFQDISEAFDTALNSSSGGITIASLNYKDGKVNLFIKPNTQLINVKIAEYIAKELRIAADKTNIGEPIDVNKIAFHNTSATYLICDQVNSNTYINSQRAETCITASPFNTEVISFKPSQPTHFHAPVGELTFHIQDSQGNNLPIKKLFCRLTINDERLR